MASVTESVDVDVPVSDAYNQWTQFDRFPQFMAGVDAVEQVDDTHLRWTISIGGATRQFDAVITEQYPDERIAWRSTEGSVHAAGVGPWDGWIRSGHSALSQPLPLTLGSDLSGTVAAV